MERFLFLQFFPAVMKLTERLCEIDMAFRYFSERMGRLLLPDQDGNFGSIVTNGVLYRGYTRGYAGLGEDLEFLQTLDNLEKVQAYRAAHLLGTKDRRKILTSSSDSH